MILLTILEKFKQLVLIIDNLMITDKLLIDNKL